MAAVDAAVCVGRTRHNGCQKRDAASRLGLLALARGAVAAALDHALERVREARARDAPRVRVDRRPRAVGHGLGRRQRRGLVAQVGLVRGLDVRQILELEREVGLVALEACDRRSVWK